MPCARSIGLAVCLAAACADAPRAPAPCRIEADAAALDFGGARIGASEALAVSLRNVGDAPCAPIAARLADGTDPAFSLEDGGAPLPPGGTHAVEVRFAPTRPGAFSGALQVDAGGEARTFPLSGEGVERCLHAGPERLDWTVTAATCPVAGGHLTLLSRCRAPVRVTGLSLDGATDAFVLAAPALPCPLSPPRQLGFDVRFAPPAPGVYDGAVLVHSDDGPEPLRVLARGTSLAGPQRDEFPVPPRAGVDFLFVIDNSPGMAERQASVAANLAAFLRYALQQQVDFRLAVTTTDPADDGRLRPLDGSRPRVLTPATPDVEQLFALAADVGTDGSGSSQPFEMALRALETAVPGGANEGLLRPEALLSVFVVTDARDGSSEGMATYLHRFLAIRGVNRSNLFSFSAVVVTDRSAPGYDERLVGMARATGGIAVSIDTSDWGRELERLGTLCWGPNTRFLLSAWPDVAFPLRLLYDGVEVIRDQGGIRLWDYDRFDNVISVHPIAIPEPGSTVVVEYVPVCPG